MTKKEQTLKLTIEANTPEELRSKFKKIARTFGLTLVQRKRRKKQ